LILFKQLLTLFIIIKTSRHLHKKTTHSLSLSFSLFSSARQNRDDSKDDSDDGKVVLSPTKAALKAAADKDKEEKEER